MHISASTPTLDDATDSKALRTAFGAFATGVTVVTTGGAVPHAMTANSFTSVSLSPPLLLVCVAKSAMMHRRLAESSFFGVSVLAGHQEAAARHFADRYRALGAAQFAQVDVELGELTRVPLIADAAVSFECDLWRAYDGGDHTIFLGKVLSMRQRPGSDGLLVYRGRFAEIDAASSEGVTA
ncbi:flavin reductase family protein [Nonomuraea sp. NPDC049400]|uniref:flavin reductase family protein n=1 Tax=Nonomuraea sp. NPDC049400 TaxID=3364352 RepID=UPI003788C415